MPNALQAQIEKFAAEFAQAVLQAIRAASLDDILAETQGSPPRWAHWPPPGSTVGTQARIDIIVAYVKGHPGTSGKDARDALAVFNSDWSRYVAKAVKAGLITKKGDRRGTTYWPA
jgi:hypothetical protein